MHFKHLAAGALMASAASAQSAPNLTAALNSSSDLTQLDALLSTNPSLLNTLANAQNITILAPSNSAISAFLNTTEGVQASVDPDYLGAVLTYHILNGTYYASQITNTSTFVPTMLSNATNYTSLASQVVEAVTTSNGSVAFFSALKQQSTVTTANTNFTGGVIHIIDTVLTIPGNVSSTAVQANLTSLAGAVTTLDLVSPLQALDEVTIFAPNNAAFQAIGSALGNLSTSNLTSILEYHVVPGAVAYSSLLANESVTSLSGPNLTISIIDGEVFVNSAKVITPDVLISNGVVHVIDAVLNPNNTSIAPDATASTAAPAFSGASSVTSVPFTSGVATPSSSVPAASTATTGAAASPSGSGAATGTSTAGAATWPIQTGAMGAAALFGAAVLIGDW